MSADIRGIDDIEGAPVEPFRGSDLPGEQDLPHDVRWQEYYTVRNSVLEALRPFGSVGPLGTARITDEKDGPPSPWPVECERPEFFVVEDMWNDWDRFVRVEVTRPDLLTTRLFQRLRTMLSRRHPHWAIGLAVGDGYVFMSSQRFRVKGPAFARCRTVGEVVRACAMDRGRPE